MNYTTIIRDDTKMFTLEKDEHEALYLSVVCGGIGMYEARIKLNDDEVANYKSGGKEYLDGLAYDISHGSLGFESRMI